MEDPWAVYESERERVLEWGQQLTEPLVIQHNRYAAGEGMRGAEREIAFEYYRRREKVRGYEGFILGRLEKHKASQRFLRQLIEVHVRTVLQEAPFPAEVHVLKTKGRVTGRGRVTTKTVSRDFMKMRPALAIDAKIGRNRHVASLLHREKEPLPAALEDEIADMLARKRRGEFADVEDIGDLRLFEPPIARSLLSFRDTCIEVFDELVGRLAHPTDRQRWLRLLLRWHTNFLVSLHSTCTGAAGLQYLLGHKATRVDLLLHEVQWRLFKSDVEESIPVLAQLWYDEAPFVPWLYEVSKAALRHEQLPAAMATWKYIFWEAWQEYPHHAAYACRDLGMIMHGAWISGGGIEWRDMAGEWFAAAILLFRDRDEGQVLLAAWCLHGFDPDQCLELVPDFKDRLANLDNPPDLLRELMNRQVK